MKVVAAVGDTVKSAAIAAWNAAGEFLTNLWNSIVETEKRSGMGWLLFFASQVIPKETLSQVNNTAGVRRVEKWKYL